jgi:multiple sugar transport system ATP-binding protein
MNIGDGEFVSLLGPSGCGKSTILNMIAGLIPQDEGTILIDGKDVSAFAPKDRRVALVFQDYALYPHMSVEQNLAFPLKAISTPTEAIRERVDIAARSLGIGDLLQRLPRELSGGQRQRVALGRALVREPSVFLMDEPLSNLDAKLRIQMRAELKMLSRRLRTTTVYVTHDQAEAMTLSDRIAIIDHGVLQQCGTPHEVYDTPVNTFVATFMGTMPMNFLAGRIEFVGGRPTFHGEHTKIDLIPGLFCLNALTPEHQVLLGIRPEDLVLEFQADDPKTAWPKFDAVISMVEDLGADLFVYAECADGKLIVRSPVGTSVAPGRVTIRLNPKKLHLFDTQTQRRITAQSRGTA